MYEKNKDSIITELINLTKLSNQYVDNQEEFVEFVKDIVKNYMQKRVDE